MIEYENLKKLNEPFEQQYELAFKHILERGWYVLGEEVKRFEKEFSSYLNAGHCVGVASGLDAMTLGLIALELPPGSEVIVPSNTYIATILSILQAGHIPVLVEPDVTTYNIDPAKIARKITSKTKVLSIVHLYGKCCDMDPILEICQKYNLHLLEDAAQAHGAKYKGKMAGTFGIIGAFSFYPTKNLGALGDAGAMVTPSAEMAQKVRTLRNYGSQIKYHNERIGFNSRLDELQAAFLRIKLKDLDKINSHKRRLARIYHDLISDNFIKPVLNSDFYDVFHIYNIRHPRRDDLKDYLLKNDIKTEIHYPVPPHEQIAMRGILDMEKFDLSKKIHSTTLSLPISYFHSEKDIRQVAECVNSFLKV
jgi:dTDP-4-amino-4,6-dideoxygalactose transaminase